MAPCAIALQEMLNICHCYNVNALTSFCFVLTCMIYVVKAHKDDGDMLRQIGMLFFRANRL